ncbi:hypothetical protein JOB18_030508 [Solea senegalensis]|uniref:Uncharacterized protein n=1 Tax=Solea senegalensis TaxID=28829 RepID=A0AAV6RIT9_SOLSE|nr:hypothetical protein JOB18_030508 [Solea senegalensis]
MTLVISNTCGCSSSPAPDEQSGGFLSLCRPSHQRQIVVALPVVTMSLASPRVADSPQPISAVGTSPVSIHHHHTDERPIQELQYCGDMRLGIYKIFDVICNADTLTLI